MSYDLAIVNGHAIFPGEAVENATIAVKDGKIAAVLAPESQVEARDIVDARGQFVAPGIVEPHSHLGIGDGYNDFVTETRSALLGGVTTILHFLRHPQPYDETFTQTVAAGEANSFVDFGFHMVLLTDEHLASIPRYVNDYGVTTFKFYMTYRTEDAAMMDFDGSIKRADGIDDGFMFDCLEAIARTPKAMMIVHCENIELIRRLKYRFKAEGRQDMNAWQASRPALAEVEAVDRLCRFALATGARAHVLHLTTGAGLETIAQARAQGARVGVEVCHPYLLVADDGNLGRVAKMKPPIRPRADVEALWRGVADGWVDTIGSDHVPRPLAPKEGELWTAATGAPGTPTMLPAMLEEGYHRRGIPLARLIDLLTRQPAQHFGLGARKGSLRVGADADLTVIDLHTPRTVRAAEIGSVAGYSLYEGVSLRGWPTFVSLRGRPVVRHGCVLEEARGHGEYLPRGASGREQA
jgi:dihydropyrimidinase